MRDIRSIVAAGIHLHGTDRDMSGWQAVVENAERRIDLADPAEIGRICRRVAAVHTATDWAFKMSIPLHADIRRRAAETPSDPDVAALLTEQRDEAERLGNQLLDLRTRLRRLDGRIGGAISALRGQSIDERLLRTVADGTPRDLDAIAEALRADHHAIADAMGDWRTMHSRGAVLLIAGSTDTDDIHAALRRLEAGGLATRSRGLLLATRWTLAAAPLAKAA